MFLTGARLTRMGSSNGLANVFSGLWPDGTQMTPAKFTRLHREAAKANVTINWRWFAENTLTHRGQHAYHAKQDELYVETYPALQPRRDLAQAAYYRALATWRKKHNVGPHTRGDRDVRREFDAIETKRRDALRKVDLEYNRAEADTYTPLIEDYCVRILQTEPRSARQADGTVIVTSRTLETLGSCGEYVDKFQHSWPNGTVITEELCVQNHTRFDWGWAAANLLAPGNYDNWVAATRERNAPLQTTRHELDARYNSELSDLQSKYNQNQLTYQQYTRKLNELDNNFSTAVNTQNTERATVNARVFAEMYTRMPNPRLPELAY